MTKKIVPSKNYNLEEYYDSAELQTTLTAGVFTATITVPANSLVQQCFAQQVIAPVSDGGASVYIGDSNDSDGFIKEFYPDPSDNELIGNDTDYIGDYIIFRKGVSSDETSLDEQPEDGRITHGSDNFLGKYYPTETAITMTVTTTGSIITKTGKFRFWLKIQHLITNEN